MHPSWQSLKALHGADAAAALAAAAAQMGPHTQQIWGAGDGTFLPGGCGQRRVYRSLSTNTLYQYQCTKDNLLIANFAPDTGLAVLHCCIWRNQYFWLSRPPAVLTGGAFGTEGLGTVRAA